MARYKLYHDEEHENVAKIETGLKILPYKGAPKAEPAARLTLSAMYDNDFVYHVSVYEKLQFVGGYGLIFRFRLRSATPQTTPQNGTIATRRSCPPPCGRF